MFLILQTCSKARIDWADNRLRVYLKQIDEGEMYHWEFLQLIPIETTNLI